MAFTEGPRPSKFNYWSLDVVKACEGKLLPHQYEALTRLQRWFCKDRKKERALVSMPTGSGKTGVICLLPYFLAQKKPEEDGEKEVSFEKPILVIAPNLAIASQLEQQILISADGPEKNFMLRRGIVPIKHHRDVLPSGVKVERTADVSKQEYLRSKEVVIANAQKFLSDSWEKNLSDDLFEMVIVDEAHHFPAETWSKIIRKFEAHALIVFFTATPYRSDGQDVVNRPFVYHLPLDEAIANKIIRPTRWDELNQDSDDPDSDELNQDSDSPDSDELNQDSDAPDSDELNQDSDVPDSDELNQDSDDPDSDAKRRMIAVQMILEKVKRVQDEKNRRQPLPANVPHMAIAICRDTNAADEAVNMWNNMYGDHKATAVHSGMQKRKLKKAMERIDNNDVELVVVVDMLQEGFDHPPISIAAIMTKIVSPVKFVQFIGRAQRVVREGGDQESPEIYADIISHSYFEQNGNYDMFRNEQLINIKA